MWKIVEFILQNRFQLQKKHTLNIFENKDNTYLKFWKL